MDPRLRMCVFCRQALRQSVSPRTTTSAPAIKQLTRNISSSAPRRRSLYSLESNTSHQAASLKTLDNEFRIRRLANTQLRTIASSRTPQQQVALQNPRQDDDGNEMVVEITPRAADRLKQIMTNDKNPQLALRITVESGGCHGFQYLMSLTDMSKVSEDDDTVFQGPDGARVVLDEPSLELLKGSKVDYTMELIGSQFKIVDNPLATSSCGCGTSFDIKE